MYIYRTNRWCGVSADEVGESGCRTGEIEKNGGGEYSITDGVVGDVVV